MNHALVQKAASLRRTLVVHTIIEQNKIQHPYLSVVLQKIQSSNKTQFYV
jgi:hypothetical protein